MPRCQIVLPARLASTRLPEKLLRRVAGKTVLQHTFEAARKSTLADRIVIAVDDPRVAEAVDDFGGTWVMTRADCASGTDRIAEVARTTGDVDIFVNVQADEPEIDPNVIDLVAARLIDDDTADMATAGTPIRSEQLLNDPSCVKIVMAWETDSKSRAGKGRAVYFSRATVPFVRDGVRQCHFNTEPPLFWHHIGLYAYRRDFLEWFAEAPPGALEQAEKLEQLRAIEAGKRIVVERVESATPGIDTEADLDAFTKRLEKTPKT